MQAGIFEQGTARQTDRGFVLDLEIESVVTRYAAVPERGRRVIAHHPVLPFENVHRTMTQRQYNWVLRQKGTHNLSLPRNPHEFITHGVFDRPPEAGKEG